jgi:hypothetical protein
LVRVRVRVGFALTAAATKVLNSWNKNGEPLAGATILNELFPTLNCAMI